MAGGKGSGGGEGGAGRGVLWAVRVLGVVRAVRTPGGVGMHWQPLNTFILKMQPMNKESTVGGKEAVGRRKEAIGVVLWAGGHGHALAAFKYSLERAVVRIGKGKLKVE